MEDITLVAILLAGGTLFGAVIYGVAMLAAWLMDRHDP